MFSFGSCNLFVVFYAQIHLRRLYNGCLVIAKDIFSNQLDIGHIFKDRIKVKQCRKYIRISTNITNPEQGKQLGLLHQSMIKSLPR